MNDQDSKQTQTKRFINITSLVEPTEQLMQNGYRKELTKINCRYNCAPCTRDYSAVEYVATRDSARDKGRRGCRARVTMTSSRSTSGRRRKEPRR